MKNSSRRGKSRKSIKATFLCVDSDSVRKSARNLEQTQDVLIWSILNRSISHRWSFIFNKHFVSCLKFFPFFYVRIYLFALQILKYVALDKRRKKFLSPVKSITVNEQIVGEWRSFIVLSYSTQTPLNVHYHWRWDEEMVQIC